MTGDLCLNHSHQRQPMQCDQRTDANNTMGGMPIDIAERCSFASVGEPRLPTLRFDHWQERTYTYAYVHLLFYRCCCWFLLVAGWVFMTHKYPVATVIVMLRKIFGWATGCFCAQKHRREVAVVSITNTLLCCALTTRSRRSALTAGSTTTISEKRPR